MFTANEISLSVHGTFGQNSRTFTMAKKSRKRGPYLREVEDSEALGTGGIRVRQHRLARMWSVERLADAAGLSQGTISSIESGKGGYSHLTLIKLAKALQTTVGALFDVDPRHGAGAVFWPLWNAATPAQRQRIIDYARGVVGKPVEK
jgi:transcriptional regulator with XRE-family HTH domain